MQNKNDKNERNIRSTNSISQAIVLLCLALPLTLTTGYASDSSRRTDTTSFIDVPTPVAEGPATDRVINNEIFYMALADTNTDYNMIASATNGAVTVNVTSTNRFESQRMVNKMWQLRGVEQVKDERGVDVASTLAEKFTIAR